MSNVRLKEILKNKKHIFFDVGFTLDKPLSGDWIFINKFYELVGDKINNYSKEELEAAKKKAVEWGEKHHKISTIEEEIDNLTNYYLIINDYLNLGLTSDECKTIAKSRALDMNNYVAYPNVREILTELKKYYTISIISDTYPSIDNQLKHLGIEDLFDFYTYSFELGVFKPNELMYKDALSKCKYEAKDTIFIDDSVINLEGAEKLGITPILIAANPTSDINTKYCKIYSLNELVEALD